MSLINLQKEINHNAGADIHEYLKEYHRLESEFFTWFESFSGSKVDLYYDVTNPDEIETVKFLLLFSDFLSVFPYDPNNLWGSISAIPESSLTRKISITAPNGSLQKLLQENDENGAYPAYQTVREDDYLNLTTRLEPFITDEKAFIRPRRIGIVFRKTRSKKYKGSFTFYSVDPSSSITEWQLLDSFHDQKSIPVQLPKHSKKPANYQDLFNITLPVLKNLETSDYLKILKDEADLLSNFRSGIKQLIVTARGDIANLQEFQKDVLRPEVDKIERRFRHISGMHRFRLIGTTVATAGISLVGILNTGILGGISGFLGLAVGSVGIMKTETDYQEAMFDLRERPLYLVWKLGKYNR